MDPVRNNNGGDQQDKDLQSKAEEGHTEYKSAFATDLNNFLNSNDATQSDTANSDFKSDYERMKELLSEMKVSGWLIKTGNLSEEAAKEGIKVIETYLGTPSANVHVLAYTIIRFEE